jgi:hypothetical protein
MMKTCNEIVYDLDAPPPAPPKPKRSKGKKTKPSSIVSTQQSQIGDNIASAVAPPSSPAANTRRYIQLFYLTIILSKTMY